MAGEATALNNVTTRDTARLPLEFLGGTDEVISDHRGRLRQRRSGLGRAAGQGRLGATCAAGHRRRAQPGPRGRRHRRHPGSRQRARLRPDPHDRLRRAVRLPGQRLALPLGRTGRAALPVVPGMRGRLRSWSDMAAWESIPDADSAGLRADRRSTTGQVLIAWSPASSTVAATRRSRRPVESGDVVRHHHGSPVGTFAEGEAPTITGVVRIVRRGSADTLSRPDRPHGAAGGLVGLALVRQRFQAISGATASDAAALVRPHRLGCREVDRRAAKIPSVYVVPATWQITKLPGEKLESDPIGSRTGWRTAPGSARGTSGSPARSHRWPATSGRLLRPRPHEAARSVVRTTRSGRPTCDARTHQ